MAGLSVEYYTKLEQGRAANPSDSVLNAMAGVLKLNSTERAYLWRVSRLDIAPVVGPLTLPAPVHLMVRRLGELMPAFVITPSTEIVAWNAAGAVAFSIPEDVAFRNVTRRLFLDPATESLYGDWEQVIREQVAWLRYDLAFHPGDRDLAELIDAMYQESPRFRRLWDQQGVDRRSHGQRIIHHPDVGTLRFLYTALPLPADPRLTIITWSAQVGSDTEARLADLLTRTAGVVAPVALADHIVPPTHRAEPATARDSTPEERPAALSSPRRQHTE